MSAARDERGVATVWGIALIGLLALVTVVAIVIVALFAGHRRAQAAADLAALAGAGALRDGADACRTAEWIAARNHAELAGCDVDGMRVRVVTQVDVRGLFGHEHVLRAQALAGPEVTP